MGVVWVGVQEVRLAVKGLDTELKGLMELGV